MARPVLTLTLYIRSVVLAPHALSAGVSCNQTHEETAIEISLTPKLTLAVANQAILLLCLLGETRK